MEQKKLFHICRNIIAITLSIAMIMYFGYAHSSLLETYADTDPGFNGAEGEIIPDSTEIEDDELGEDEKTEEDTENSENPEDEEISPLDLGGEPMAEVDVDTVIATITYSYSTTPEGEDPDLNNTPEGEDPDLNNTPEGEDPDLNNTPDEDPELELASEDENKETVTLEFYTLSEAFNGTIQATEVMAAFGEAEYVPTIQIVEDFTLMLPAVNERNSSFIIDLNGHCITCGENSYIDFGEGVVTITDEAYANGTKTIDEETGEEADPLLGRIVGTVPYIFTGIGELTFDNGYFENDYFVDNIRGYIVDNEGILTFNEGCFIAHDGQIVNTISGEDLVISVRGGFYSFDLIKGFSNLGITMFEDKKDFVGTDIVIGEDIVSGYVLDVPDYQVAISVAATPENGLLIDKEVYSYHIDTQKAWEKAVELSKNNASALASISICNKEITEFGINRTLNLNATEDGKTAQIMFVNVDFTRIDLFDGNLFEVTGGKVIFDRCNLDGYINDESVSQGSVIRVLADGTVTLKDTSITRNRSIINGQINDPGAGVYLAAGATLNLSGEVKLANNTLYTPATAYEKSYTTNQNLYLADGARVTLLGKVTGHIGDIGITNEKGTIAGLTAFGSLEQSYLESLEDTLSEETLNVFTIDNYPSFFMVFNKDTNSLFWDKTVRYLPEAGAIRFEFVVLLIGLMCFVLRNAPVIRERKGIEIVTTVIAITCLVSGTTIGFINLRVEQHNSQANQLVLRELTASQQAQAASSDYATEYVEESETIEEADKTTYLGVPNDGRDYYGIMVIEELGIRLPVLKEYTDANMKTTPCVYYGQAESNNLVIVGHNYDSQLGDFNNIDQTLNITLYLMDGSVYNYQSTDVEYLDPSQVDEMLMGHWDLTVFTCSYSGEKRIAVRCNELQ